jgi:hypothetical protein
MAPSRCGDAIQGRLVDHDTLRRFPCPKTLEVGGKGEFVSGKGKYQGITGQFSYTGHLGDANSVGTYTLKKQQPRAAVLAGAARARSSGLAGRCRVAAGEGVAGAKSGDRARRGRAGVDHLPTYMVGGFRVS